MSIYDYNNLDKLKNGLISTEVDPFFSIAVCIPCYNETECIHSLQALANCNRPDGIVEVIILINDREKDSDEIKIQNTKAYHEIIEAIPQLNKEWMRFYPIYIRAMSNKKGGVGLARRLAMDEACLRFEKIKNKSGILACYDADSKCESNYFTELQRFFDENPKKTACSIHYEHPFEELPIGANRDAIVQYELHLRCYNNMQRLLNLPFAFQTVGSSMAVLSSDYRSQGGMNSRQAGEDFYFLQKFISVGRCGELSNTKIIPSCRPSDRVPFGTGRAIMEILDDNKSYSTYNPDSFKVLQVLLDQLIIIYKSSDQSIHHFSKNQYLIQFFEKSNWKLSVEEIKSNTKDYPSFEKRFYKWFNAFALMKYLHFMRDHGYPDVSISDGIIYLFERLNLENSNDAERNLMSLRNKDCDSKWWKNN